MPRADSTRAARRAAAAGLVVTLALAASGAARAGAIEVHFVDPEHFTDIGFASFERERALSTLTQAFERLAGKLPDGQTLKLEVLDVDLAGNVWPRFGNEYRILRGGIDWPRMTVRYTLSAEGRTLKTGQDKLADMNYLFNLRGVTASDGNLPYEKRMLERWFAETFLAAH